MTSRSEIFGFKFESQDFQIYSYADETGLLSHATIQEVDRARFAFLVNAPLDVSMQVTGQFSYVFYLDTEPVERKFLPQNYQLRPVFQSLKSKVLFYFPPSLSHGAL